MATAKLDSPSTESDGMLGRLYRASPEGLAMLIKTVPPQSRAALAVYCLQRENLRALGLVIAESCERRDLLCHGGSAAWGIIQRYRESEQPVGYDRRRSAV